MDELPLAARKINSDIILTAFDKEAVGRTSERTRVFAGSTLTIDDDTQEPVHKETTQKNELNHTIQENEAAREATNSGSAFSV